MKINWIQKLSSRKFWLALIGFVTAVLVSLNVAEFRVEQIQGVLWSLAPLVAFILAEGYTDAHRIPYEED
jgi:hypothetical protein